MRAHMYAYLHTAYYIYTHNCIPPYHTHPLVARSPVRRGNGICVMQATYAQKRYTMSNLKPQGSGLRDIKWDLPRLSRATGACS